MLGVRPPLSKRALEDVRQTDLLPKNRTIYGWNFPIMIPGSKEADFHEGIDVFRATDSVFLKQAEEVGTQAMHACAFKR